MAYKKLFTNWEEFVSSNLEYYVKMDILSKSLPFRNNPQELRQE